MHDERTVELIGWTGPWVDDDPDANFKAEVTLYAHVDPLITVRNLAGAVGIPVGGLCHHVLAKWATEGSRSLLELGPTMVRRLAGICDDAEATAPTTLASRPTSSSARSWRGCGTRSITPTSTTAGERRRAGSARRPRVALECEAGHTCLPTRRFARDVQKVTGSRQVTSCACRP